MASRNEVPITETAGAPLPGARRRWEQAVDALSSAREAEDYQAIGVRLRECLVSFVADVANDDSVLGGSGASKRGEVVGWTNLLVNELAQDRAPSS